jgi:hypothetical protein
MMSKKIFLIGCLLLSSVLNAWAADKSESEVWLRIQDSKLKQTEAYQSTNYFKKINLSCGIPPIPPIGCKVGACQCDQNGNNCRWTFNCG